MNLTEQNALAAALGSGEANNLAPDVLTVPGDAAIAVDRDSIILATKGSAAALTLAAPGAANIGRKIVVIGGTDFAHVITAVGVHDGTTGAHTTLTSAAFIGSTLTLRAISATQWAVEANNLWVIT